MYRIKYFTMVVLLLLMTLISMHVSTAKASAPSAHSASFWSLTDGIEGPTPSSRWFCEILTPAPTNLCRFYLNQTVPSPFVHSGVNSVGIFVTTGWIAIGRTVTITPYVAGKQMSCTAQVYLNTQGPGTNGQIQILDANTRNVVVSTGFTSGTYGWFPLSINWNPYQKDVYFRILITGKGANQPQQSAFVDDLTVQCYY